LRRRLGQGGRETVEHPTTAHDDLSCSISGAIWLCTPIERAVATDFEGIGVVVQQRDSIAESGEQSETWKAWLATQNYGRAPDGGLARGNASRGWPVLW
jgi:hypothetical protein